MKNCWMAFFRNRAGMFVMIAPNMDWETVMTSYDARNNVEIAFDIFKSELDGRRGRTERTKRVREIFSLFGVDDPDQLPIAEPSE